MAFVTDSFTGDAGTNLASHAGETGATWVRVTGITSDLVLTDGNRVRYDVASGEARYYASGTPAGAEYDVEADFYRHGTLTNDEEISIDARVVTNANTGYLCMYRTGSGTPMWELYKVVAGSYTQVGSYTQTLTADTAYHAKFEVRNAAKKVYVDGTERISSDDNDITAAGRAGVGGYSNATRTNANGMQLDGYSASDPDSGTPAAGAGARATFALLGVGR